MNALLLKTFNLYLGTEWSAAEATGFLARIRVLPLPDRISLDDWRFHVPMHLLEAWSTLSDEDRLTIYVMAESATHPYEAHAGPEEPAMN